MSLTEARFSPGRLRQAFTYAALVPTFRAELQRYGESTPQKNSHISLFLASGTNVSELTFNTTVRGVYPQATCSVFNLDGAQGKEHLPFKGGSLDSVLATQLMTSHKSDNERRIDILNQTAKLLKNDGMLLMVESSFDYSYMTELIQAGFSSVAVVRPTGMIGKDLPFVIVARDPRDRKSLPSS